MSGKINNRLLLVVFAGLAAIFVITRLTTVKKANRSLQTDIVEIDTSRVSSIFLYPRAERGKEIEFSRNGSSWTVSKGEISATADVQSIRSTLGELQNLNIEQLVARSSTSWNEYQVNDSLGTRIILKEGKKTTADLVIGRFHYEPAPGGYNMYGQNRGTGKTYLRLHNDEEVYSAEGFLAMSINQPFERWRDQTITQMSASQLTKIIYDYPADSGFVADRTEAGWLVAGLLADSASMATYLNGLSRRTHSDFSDDFQPTTPPDYQVTFEGDNMQPLQIRAFSQPGDSYILNSNVNPDSWFRITREGLFKDLFPGSAILLSGEN